MRRFSVPAALFLPVMMLILAGVPGWAEVIRPYSSAPDATKLQDVFHEYLILDAAGRPAAGFEAELDRRNFHAPHGQQVQPVHRTTLPADGVLRLHRTAVRKPGSTTPDGHPITNSDDVLTLRVGDPANGQKQVITLPRNEFGNSEATGTVRLALVKEPTQLPLFSGRVLDAKGEPASGLALQLQSIGLPGGLGGHGAPEEEVQIEVGPKGEFRFFATTRSFLQDTEKGPPVLPPGSTADLRLVAAGVQFDRSGPGGHTLTLGQPATLRLAAQAPLTFRVVDSGGKPALRAEVGQSFEFTFRESASEESRTRPLKTRIAWADPQAGLLRTEPVPIPGFYAPFYGAGRSYEMKEVTTATVEQPVVWSLKPAARRMATGRVLDAVSGAPLAGAYVAICSSQGEAWKLARMGDEGRETLWTVGRPKDPPYTREESALIMSAPPVTATARTDELGRYTLENPETAQVGGLIFWAPGTIPVSVNMLNIPDELVGTEQVTMPDLFLIPSAEVRVRVNSPGFIPAKDLSGSQPEREVGLGTALEFQMPPEWKARSPLPSSEGDYQTDWRRRIFWTLECAETWNRLDTEWPVLVPAGVAGVRVKVSAPYAEVLDDTAWELGEVINVSTTRTLPPQTAGLKRPYIIQVNNADGKPAAGISVQVPERPVLVTNSEGKVIAWSSGVVSSIRVVGPTHQPLATKKDVSVPDSDEMPVVTLTLQPGRKPAGD